MYDMTFPVHGKAAFVVTPQSDRAIPRSEPIKPGPKIIELGAQVGDMHFHEYHRRVYVVKEICENYIKCVYQRASGDFSDENISAHNFKMNMRLIKKGNPEYWHSFLVRPQGKGKELQSKPVIVGILKEDERIKKIGAGRELSFHIEDIKEHYPWYKF